MKIYFSKNFTLLELVVVIVIILTLASLGVPTYFKTLEKVKCNEAITYLKLIQAVENRVFLERDNFLGCTDTADCSAKLELYLPEGTWNYTVSIIGGNDKVNVTAERLPVSSWAGCKYSINSTADATVNSGCIYTEP